MGFLVMPIITSQGLQPPGNRVDQLVRANFAQPKLSTFVCRVGYLKSRL
jgi:hypothetical protein